MMTEILFWTLSVVVAYIYAGYPLSLALATAGRVRRPKGKALPDGDLPKVSLLISAFNEADCIAAKLDNTLSLDYPRDRLEVIVISDASDDGTDEIVESYASRNVRLIRMPQRGGKTVGLNMGVSESSGPILIFSDANAMYRHDALLMLVSPFADAEIGAVIGESSYAPSELDSGRSESLYWRYETWIKELESRRGSVVGGDGAIYAVRRNLYQPMSPDALSDFVNPLQVVRSGYRCVYEPMAVSFEEAAVGFYKEYRRKVRIVNRAWRALWAMRSMLNPFKYGAFALKLWSHKVLRWWAPVALIGIFVSNIFLLHKDLTYIATFLGQCLLYGMAGIGFLLRDNESMSAFIRIPFYFCLVNAAAAVGLMEAMEGKSYTTWATARAKG